MEFELRLPDVGEGIAEGEIVRWLVSEGDRVAEDDLLVEGLTGKGNGENPHPPAGTVSRIVAQPGQVVKVGEVMAVLEVAGGKEVSAARDQPSPAPAAPPKAPA